MPLPTKLSQLDAYTSPWLKAADLQGRAHRLKVERATVEEVRQADGSKELKVIVTFEKAKKRLICNKTQALTLADAAHTEEFNRWAGLTVILEPAVTRGKDTINIRQLPPAQGNGAAPAAAQSPAPAAGADLVSAPGAPTAPATVTHGEPPPLYGDNDNPFDDDQVVGMPPPNFQPVDPRLGG